MDGGKRPTVSVAILTWNRRDHVAKAIESVMAQDYKPLDIVVADSASSDGTVEFIGKHYPKVKVIRLHRNLGCPEGRNVAMANCRGDVIYALDDDGWLAPDTLRICMEKLERHPDAGVIACRVVAPDEPASRGAEDRWHHSFSGGASAIRRTVLETAGYYPSDFFRQGEEDDLAIRMIEHDFRILHCPEAIMYHERSAINRDSSLFLYFSCRNELYTVLRRYPWRYLGPAAAQKVITWNYLGLRRGALWYSLAGTLSALGSLPRLLREREPVVPRTVRRLWSMKWSARRVSPRGVDGAVAQGRRAG